MCDYNGGARYNRLAEIYGEASRAAPGGCRDARPDVRSSPPAILPVEGEKTPVDTESTPQKAKKKRRTH